MVDLAWFWPVKGWLLRCSTAAMLCNKFSVLNSGPAAVGKKWNFLVIQYYVLQSKRSNITTLYQQHIYNGVK